MIGFAEKKKQLNQTQALAKWMKSGKWIDLNNAKSELGITRLPEIIRRLKWLLPSGVFDEKTVTVNSRYGKTHYKRWRVNNFFIYEYKNWLHNILK